jgi:ABC-type uncharacterized transport system involved in gliding motility auxiliary subunit
MKLNEFVHKRQVKYGAYAAVYIVVVLTVLSLLNWGVNKYVSKSWDLTANKQYSLSDQTRKLVSGLKVPVHVSYFAKRADFARGQDLLDQYSHLSSKLTVDYIDPDRDPGKAREMGVKAYGSIILISGDKRQEANVLDEESVTTALIRVVKSGTKNVCFVEGHGELSPDDSDRLGLSTGKKELEDSNYKVKTISLLNDPKVPADCTVTVVAGPKSEYVQTEIDALRSYVDGGGRAFFMVAPGSSDNLVNMLAGWNVVLKKDVVVDLNPLNQLYGASEAMPIISSYKSHEITRELTRVATIMPLARTVEPGKDPKPGVTVETLFETSANSWATAFSAETKSVVLKQDKDTRGPLSVAVAGTVKPQGAEQKPVSDSGPAEGRFVVIGSGRFPANSYITFNGNGDLFVNTVNWLASDEDLISIRPKAPEDRRVNLSIAQMRGVFYLSIIFIPLAMVFGGFAVWWKRR